MSGEAPESIVQHYAYSSFGKIIKIEDANGNDVTTAPLVKISYGHTNREWRLPKIDVEFEKGMQ